MTKEGAFRGTPGPTHPGHISGRWIVQGTEPAGPVDTARAAFRAGEPVARGRRSEAEPVRGPLPEGAAFLLQTCSDASGRAWTAGELAQRAVRPGEREALLRLRRAEEERCDTAREGLQEVWGITVGRRKCPHSRFDLVRAHQGGK